MTSSVRVRDPLLIISNISLRNSETFASENLGRNGKHIFNIFSTFLEDLWRIVSSLTNIMSVSYAQIAVSKG